MLINSTVGKTELGLQDLVISVGPEANETGGLRRWHAAHDVAVVQRGDWLAVDCDLSAPVTRHLDIDDFARIEHE